MKVKYLKRRGDMKGTVWVRTKVTRNSEEEMKGDGVKRGGGASKRRIGRDASASVIVCYR